MFSFMTKKLKSDSGVTGAVTKYIIVDILPDLSYAKLALGTSVPSRETVMKCLELSLSPVFVSSNVQ